MNMFRVALSKIPEKLHFSSISSLNAVKTSKSAPISDTRLPSSGMSISPYAFYIKENFAEKRANKEVTKALTELASSWKNLSETEKQKYVEKSEEYRQSKISEFLALSEDKQKELIEESKAQRLERSARRQRKARREERKSSGHPVIPTNAYALFIKNEMESAKSVANNNKKVTDIVREGAKKWKELSESEKKKYNDEAKKLNDEYHGKLAEWKNKNGKEAKPDEEKTEKKQNKRSISPIAAAHKKQ